MIDAATFKRALGSWPSGCPRIPGALVYLDCAVVQAVTAGTHMIYIGLVEAAVVDDAAPLAFHRGRYCRLTGS